MAELSALRLQKAGKTSYYSGTSTSTLLTGLAYSKGEIKNNKLKQRHKKRSLRAEKVINLKRPKL